MRLMLQLLVLVAVATLAFVLIRQHRESVERAGWAHFAEAHDQGMTVASLDAARDQAAGSAAEPWIAFELALKLYEQGTPADLQRALEVSRDSAAKFPEHPASKAMSQLQLAIGSFLAQSGSPAAGS